MKIESLNKSKKHIEKIISKLSYCEYSKYNLKNNKKVTKKHIPYTLSDEILECLNVLKIINKAISLNKINSDDENYIKSFLLPYRTHRDI